MLDKGTGLATLLKKNVNRRDKIDDLLLVEHRKVIKTVFPRWGYLEEFKVSKIGLY